MGGKFCTHNTGSPAVKTRKSAHGPRSGVVRPRPERVLIPRVNDLLGLPGLQKIDLNGIQIGSQNRLQNGGLAGFERGMDGTREAEGPSPQGWDGEGAILRGIGPHPPRCRSAPSPAVQERGFAVAHRAVPRPHRGRGGTQPASWEGEGIPRESSV